MSVSVYAPASCRFVRLRAERERLQCDRGACYQRKLALRLSLDLMGSGCARICLSAEMIEATSSAYLALYQAYVTFVSIV